VIKNISFSAFIAASEWWRPRWRWAERKSRSEGRGAVGLSIAHFFLWGSNWSQAI